MPGGQSRWSAGKDLSWEPLRIERVCEVKYDHMQGDRFRHAAVFQRWRPDKPPSRLPLRSARGHAGLRAREGLRRAGSAVADAASSRRPCPRPDRAVPGPDEAAAGTCSRLTRMRVQVWKRPRIASTSTSAGSRCAAASGWRAFQRSRPASASSFFARASDLDQRMLRPRAGVTARRARAFARLLLVVRRPRRIAQPLALVPRRELEQRARARRRARRCRRADRRRSRTAPASSPSVKSAGSHSSISSHVSGAETRASGRGRTEYAAATVRSLAFWL